MSWGRTIGIGMQHVVAMFGATLLVPTLTGFPVNTTLLFSGIGTILFLLITRNRLPSYLGSSFAFIAPLTAATSSHDMSTALGGVVMAGLTLAAIGVVVQVAGDRWLRALMPPVVTGATVPGQGPVRSLDPAAHGEEKPGESAPSAGAAEASLVKPDGSSAGKATFSEKDGVVVIDVRVTGLPAGFQILAPAMADDRLYTVGAALEQRLVAAWGGHLLEQAPELAITKGA